MSETIFLPDATERREEINLAALSEDERSIYITRVELIRACLQSPARSRERADAIAHAAQMQDVNDATVRRWMSIYERGSDLIRLVRRPSQPRGRAINALLQNVLEAEYARTRNKKLAHQKMIRAANDMGITYPSERTCYRALEDMDRTDGGIVLLGQRKKDFYDHADLFIERDWSEVEPLKIIVGDHKQVDTLVEWFDGRLVRPWLSFWVDGGTRMLFYPSVSLTPTANSIAGSLRIVMRYWGVPQGVYVDNGKAYKAHVLEGQNFVERNFAGVDLTRESYELLTHLNRGMFGYIGNVIHAIPYNSRAKIVERYFGKGMVDQFSASLPGYTGRDYQKLPDATRDIVRYYAKKKNHAPGQGCALHVTEFYSRLIGWINEKNQTPSRAYDMVGLSPADAWRQWISKGWRPNVVTDDRMLDVLMMHSKRATTKRNGIIQFHNEMYTSDALKREFVRKGRPFDVVIKWDDTDCISFSMRGTIRTVPRELVVFDAEKNTGGHFIGVAHHWRGVPAMSEAGREMMVERLKSNRAITGEVKREAKALEEIALQITSLGEGESLDALTGDRFAFATSERELLRESDEETDAMQRLSTRKSKIINNIDII